MKRPKGSIIQSIATPQKPVKAKPVNRKFEIETEFKGYRHQYDLTKEDPNVMVIGSKNVLCRYGDEVKIREGYKYKGSKGTIINTPINTSFDFDTFSGYQSHIRGFKSGLSNDTLLQYYDPFKNDWFNFADINSTSAPSFALWWDSTTLQNKALWITNLDVSGNDPAIPIYTFLRTWTGATAEILSVGSTTITIAGTTTLPALGFPTSGSLWTNNILITYSGISLDGLSFTGVSSTVGILTGYAIVDGNLGNTQITPGTFGGGATGILNNFVADFVQVKDNHLYLFSHSNRNIYVSKVNNYTDYTFGGSIGGAYPSIGTAAREQGEGAIIQVDDFPVAAIVQEDTMYISVGKNKWYYTVQDQNTQSTSVGTGGTTATQTLYLENLYVKPLKTTLGQAAQSQELCTTIYNNIAFVSNEPTFTTIGRIKQVNQQLDGMLGSDALQSISDTIVLDFQNYDFTDGQAFYYQDAVYISVPKQGIVLIYNTLMEWWEAPQTLPIARFSIIDNKLIGHSYFTNESYQLFSGQNDINFAINANATFSYLNSDSRTEYKNFNEWYTEGYINKGTILNLSLTTDFVNNKTGKIDGSDPRYTFAVGDENYLGSKYLGQDGNGTIDTVLSGLVKYRIKNTFSKAGGDYFEVQASYSTNSLNDYWSILAYGGNVKLSNNDTNIIKV